MARDSGDEVIDLRDDAGRPAPRTGDGRTGEDDGRSATGDGRGRDADTPGEIPARGWKDVAVRVRDGFRDDNLVLIAGGVAFFALLALAPALLALVSIYGMVASPADVARQLDALSGALPSEVRTLVQDQLTQIAQTSEGRLGAQAVIGVVAALWAASSAVRHLAVALSTIYDEHEGRGFVRLRVMALAVTVAAVVFMVVALGLLAGGPTWVGANVDETLGAVLAIARWPLLAVMMMVALAVAYRQLPDRDEPRWRWTSWGAVLATVVWIVASAVFALYASRFGNYQRTYGSMAAVVVTMLWLFLTALCVLLGAEVNAELERQTARDSTVGPERPLGHRDAEVADTMGRATG